VEVESLGVLAQRKGASAVIASLWEVADLSTSKLMQNFYQCFNACKRLIQDNRPGFMVVGIFWVKVVWKEPELEIDL
jgi:hypothetical protein